MNKTNLKIGFIGLGLMGKPMALNLFKKGFEIAVYNRSKEKTIEFSRLGVNVYPTPQELADNCNLIITMVTGPQDVKEVLLGNNGVVSANNKDLICIDCSTIGPTSAQDIAQKLTQSNIAYFDAPVTGSTFKAQSGELTFFVGGPDNLLPTIVPVLQAMGKNIFYIGRVGSGQGVKLINNLLVAITVASLAEGVSLGDQMSTKRESLKTALENAPSLSFFMKMKLDNYIKDSYTAAFSVSNMAKDLNILKEELKSLNKTMPLSRLLSLLYNNGIAKGFGDLDISSIIKVVNS